MINGKNKDLYYESSIHKQLNIEVVGTQAVIDNSMRERDTFTLTETLNDGSELKFGSCLPNQISFTAHDVPAGIIGKKLRPVETLEGNEDDPFTYGEYKIYSDTPTADRTKRQIVAYDAMYDILNADVKAWYDGLSFPLTLKAFRDSFFAHLGIAQADTSLVNDGMTVNKTLTTSSSDDSAVTAEASVSGKTIIEAICEINGAFGNINRDGKFDYVILPDIISAVYPAEDLYPRNDLFPADSNTESMSGHYITFDYENFKCKTITQLEIRADDNTAGAIVGNPGNTYVISGNFLVSDKTGAELEQIANNVLPIMAQATYTPIKSCTTVGNPCLEIGDPIRFNTSREIVETYLLQRTLTGVQSKRDSIVAQGTEKHAVKANSTREMLEIVQRRTSKLERNADHLLSQYEDLEKQTNTKFEQTADAITAEATRAQGAEGNLSSQISIVAGEVSSKVSRGDVVSEINQTADTISLRAGHLEIDCNNFQVDKDTGDAKIGGTLSFYEDFSESHSGEIQYGKLPGGGSMGFNMNDSLNVSGSIFMNQSLVVTTSDITVTGFSGDSTAGVYNKIHMSGTVIDGSKISYSDLKSKLSDERLKEDISVLAGAEIEDFYMNLIPTKHRYKYGAGIGEDDKYQFGVIAQWTEKDMIGHDMDPDVYSVVRKSKTLDDTDEAQYTGGDDVYRVDYDQFHALHIYMIQMQQKEIMNLKLENVALEGELDIFNRRLKEVEAKLC
uniref:Endosialidase chaperone n=1 Tax=Siphoviridae sp. ctnFo11 TaxID=2826454 RepID=A0A8S5N5B1_9CAUD|nr:MAG TPA: endosialidase chaperone [Siphoviridae sp. ctnFo11]